MYHDLESFTNLKSEQHGKVIEMKVGMAHEDFNYFLINMNLICQHGVSHSKNKSRIQRLFAIHECHYVVEQIIREQAKDMTFNYALYKIGFDKLLKRVKI